MKFFKSIRYKQEQDQYVVKLKKKNKVWRWILLGLLGLLLLPFLLAGGIYIYAYDLFASDPIPAIQDLPEPVDQPPVWNSDDPLPKPTPGCGVQISEGHLTGRANFDANDWCGIFKCDCQVSGRNHVVYIGAGLYPDMSLLLNTSFHGLAIDKNTRLIVYKEKDFQGEKVLDVSGPLLINCSGCTIKLQPEMWMPYTDELQKLFPLKNRKLEKDFYGEGPLYTWDGSCKIICTDCTQNQ